MRLKCNMRFVEGAAYGLRWTVETSLMMLTKMFHRRRLGVPSGCQIVLPFQYHGPGKFRSLCTDAPVATQATKVELPLRGGNLRLIRAAGTVQTGIMNPGRRCDGKASAIRHSCFHNFSNLVIGKD